MLEDKMVSDFDFDLFVIGAGSAGVRAARISAQSGARVAVAEGGVSLISVQKVTVPIASNGAALVLGVSLISVQKVTVPIASNGAALVL